MRAAILLAVLGCGLGLPQHHQGASSGGANNRQGFFGPGFGPGAAFACMQRANEKDWGPKAYGPGLNNPFALNVNGCAMQRAVSVAEACPGTLVKVEVTGQIKITDTTGWDVEIMDWMGNDVTEGITDFEFEQPEPQFVIGGPPGFFGGPSGFGSGSSGFGDPSGFRSATGGFPGFEGSQGFGGPSGFGGPTGAGAPRPPCFRRRVNPF